MPQEANHLTAYIDGGSRGNPGPAAAAFILQDSKGTQLSAKAFYLGEKTNNFAEYTSIIKALESAKQFGLKQITVYSDSELLVRQLNGQYKVKSENIAPLFNQAINLLSSFETWKIHHIPREKNKHADSLVNQALDLKKDVENKLKSRNIKPVRLAVLISGGGTTLMNLLDQIKSGRLNAEIPLVISSRSEIAGVQKAKKAGLNVKIVRKKDYPDIEVFSSQIELLLNTENIDLAIQAGWLCLWNIPKKFEGKVMNIHPALLPSFGGKGMWGHHVHEAVLKAGCKVSGCTVHFCTNEYDKGPIIIQRCCPVLENDTPHSLAERVFEQECVAYPEAITLFASGKLQIKDCIVKIHK